MLRPSRFYEGCGREGPIRCIFLCEFHPTAGPKIVCQVNMTILGPLFNRKITIIILESTFSGTWRLHVKRWLRISQRVYNSESTTFQECHNYVCILNFFVRFGFSFCRSLFFTDVIEQYSISKSLDFPRGSKTKLMLEMLTVLIYVSYLTPGLGVYTMKTSWKN